METFLKKYLYFHRIDVYFIINKVNYKNISFPNLLVLVSAMQCNVECTIAKEKEMQAGVILNA